MVAACLGGIWAHRNSSCCSSDEEMRPCGLGYLWSHCRPEALCDCLCLPSCPSSHRSLSSTCHNTWAINHRLDAKLDLFRDVSSGAWAFVSSIHFIQLKRGMALRWNKPKRQEKEQNKQLWARGCDIYYNPIFLFHLKKWFYINSIFPTSFQAIIYLFLFSLPFLFLLTFLEINQIYHQNISTIPG